VRDITPPDFEIFKRGRSAHELDVLTATHAVRTGFITTRAFRHVVHAALDVAYAAHRETRKLRERARHRFETSL
jgi:hypothetical protein